MNPISQFTQLARYEDDEIEVRVAKSIFTNGDMVIGLMVWTKENGKYTQRPVVWCDTEGEALSLFRTITEG